MNEQQILAHAKLHLNISTPNVDECYAHGFEDAQNNLEEINPFPEGSIEAQYYSDGWWDAYQEFAPAHDLAINHAAEETQIPEVTIKKATTPSLWVRITQRGGAAVAVVAVFVFGYGLVDMALAV